MENQNQETAQEQKGAKKKNLLESLFSKGESKLEKLFSPREIISAKAAYMKTRYGREITDTDILREFMVRCRKMIDERIIGRHYMGTIEIEDDVVKFLPQLKKYYKDNGYGVVVLSPSTKIYNKENPEDGELTLSKTKFSSIILMLMWGEDQMPEDVIKEAKAQEGGADGADKQ